MRVTIAVDGVLREIEVRPDLLSPDMGEWQDATEMDLLRAFGSAYREAVASRHVVEVPASAAEAPAEPAASAHLLLLAPHGTADVPVAAPAVDSDAAGLVAVVAAEAVESEEEDLYAAIEPVEPVEPVESVESAVLPEPAAWPAPIETAASDEEQTPFAADAVEFAQAQVYAPSEDDAAAFLPPAGEHAATVAPVVTLCACGHPQGWHAQEGEQDFGDCQMAWPIDEKDPAMGRGKCACLRFTPTAAPTPSATPAD